LVGDENSIKNFWRQLEEHLQLYLDSLDSSGWHDEEMTCGSKIIYDPDDLTGQNNQYNIDYIRTGAADAEKWDAIFF
jgi:hypothetical protein